MDTEEMKKRTKNFAISCGWLIKSLPRDVVNNAYSSQLVRIMTKEKKLQPFIKKEMNF